MGRCFSVECIEINKAFYLQKKGNPRAPYLSFKDYLTDNKIKKNFKDDLGFFHDDIQYFPVGYTPQHKDANPEGYEIVCITFQNYP